MGARSDIDTPHDMLEAGHLESLGRHSGIVADYEPLWRKAARTLVVYLASLICLLVLDAIWMKLIAPPLGVDYFQVVRNVQGADAAGRPVGLVAYLIMGYAATFLAYSWDQSLRLGFAIYGVFDFTSTYCFHGWTVKVAILDTIWGSTLYALTGLFLQMLRPKLQRVL